jgi:DNA-binding NarL/FixJ family response regulator
MANLKNLHLKERKQMTNQNNSTEETTNTKQKAVRLSPRMAIIDDDPIVAKVMRIHLLNSFPDAIVDIFSDPMVEPNYDIYFLDNDFNGQLLGLRLLKEIRKLTPHALVVALSNTLDLETVTRLTNAGCNAVYNKRNPDKSDDARDVIRNYMAVLGQMRAREAGFSMSDVIHSMKRLLGEWNQRLAKSSASN